MYLSQKKQQDYLNLYSILATDSDNQTPEQLKNYSDRLGHLDRPLEEINAERKAWEKWATDKVYENLLNGLIVDEETGQVINANIDELKEMIKREVALV
jgi:hypothetical protein